MYEMNELKLPEETKGKQCFGWSDLSEKFPECQDFRRLAGHAVRRRGINPVPGKPRLAECIQFTSFYLCLMS